MKQVWISKIGPPETLTLREASDPIPAPGEVRVRVKAIGVNFADIMARMGLYPDAPPLPTVVGYEVSGVIDRVGEGVTSRQVGNRVIAVCRFGGYSDMVVVPETQVFPLPDRMSFSEGATLPVNYLTVYQMLVVMAGAKAGDVVLVHSAAGGIGLAAVDLGQILGVQIIGTASAAKHAVLKTRGVQHVIDYRNQDYETEVMRITNGKGVQIILDPIGGPSWKKGLRCLAPTGRLVVFGFSAMANSKQRSIVSLLKNFLSVPWLKVNPINLMNENKGVLGVNLGHMWNEQELLKTWTLQILQWYEEGRIHPTVDREFKLSQADQAHHYIQDRKNIGKVILVP